MAVSNRAKFLDQTFRLLRKTYEPHLPLAKRSVLEEALFGVCLEDAPLEAAEAAFARLAEGFFDWNEVRVSPTRELALTLEGLSEPLERGRRLKAILQSVFETHYQFDLDWLRRKTLRQASKELRKINGVTPFVEAFVLQAGLKGHAIPLDATTLRVLQRFGLAAEKTDPDDVRASLERLVPKARGPAFSSLVRQLAFDVCLPGEPQMERCVLADICPTAQVKRQEKLVRAARVASQRGRSSRKASSGAATKHRG